MCIHYARNQKPVVFLPAVTVLLVEEEEDPWLEVVLDTKDRLADDETWDSGELNLSTFVLFFIGTRYIVWCYDARFLKVAGV